MPYGNTDQNWFRLWLATWWHQTIAGPMLNRVLWQSLGCDFTENAQYIAVKYSSENQISIYLRHLPGNIWDLTWDSKLIITVPANFLVRYVATPSAGMMLITKSNIIKLKFLLLSFILDKISNIRHHFQNANEIFRNVVVFQGWTKQQFLVLSHFAWLLFVKSICYHIDYFICHLEDVAVTFKHMICKGISFIDILIIIVKLLQVHAAGPHCW